MKSILLRANRSTPLARSDHNFSVNVYGYIQFFFAGTRGTREQTHCRIKPCNINRLHINSSHFTSSPDTGCSSSLRLRCQGFSKCIFPGFLQQEPALFLKAKRSRPKLHVVSLWITVVAEVGQWSSDYASELLLIYRGFSASYPSTYSPQAQAKHVCSREKETFQCNQAHLV